MEISPQDARQHWAFSIRRGWVNYFFPDSGGIHTLMEWEQDLWETAKRTRLS